VLNCGSCGHVCGTSHATPSCAGGVCSLACEVGFGDCNGDPDDGCEVDFASDPTSCGVCGNACGDEHATATCSAGKCSLVCDAGYDDCDGEAVNGCETNLATSPFHCGACGNGCQGGVCEAMVCGAAPELVTSDVEIPSSLAVNADDLFIVGAQPLGGFAERIPKNGGALRCLSTGLSPSSGTCGFGVFEGVVVSGQEVFVTGSTGVLRYALPFGETELATGVPDAYALAVDEDSVFFTSKTQSGVFKASRSGAFQTPAEITGLSGETGGAIAVDADRVYFTSLGGAVYRMAKDGQALQQIASSQSFDDTLLTPQSFGIDEDSLYWTAKSGRIFRLKKDGSGLALLADAQAGPAGIYVESGPSGWVYWVNQDSGTVRKMAKDGSGKTTLAAGQAGPITVTADDAFVYWATEVGAVWRMGK